MATIRFLLRWLGVAILALFAAGWAPAYFGIYGLFWERYASVLLADPVSPSYRWHKPLETVAGAPDEPLVAVDEPETVFRPGVLAEAAEYARAHNSDALVVMHAGQLVFEQYWNTRKSHSLAPAHAMSHALVAILVGHAIADGHISSVNQPAFHFLAEWDDEQHRGITILHLLLMASGLKEGGGIWPWSPRVQRAFGTDIVAANLATEVEGRPGIRFAHINPPAQLLGVIVERATGRRFADYLAEKFWQPIGARDAQLLLDRPGGTAHTACCMWVAIQDWARVGEAMRTGGLWNGRRVIPEGWVERMLAPSGANLNFGMMVWLGNFWEKERRYDPDHGTAVSYHSEPFAAPPFWLDGARGQRVWVVPSRQLVIVRTGRDHPDWDDARLPNLLIRGLVQ